MHLSEMLLEVHLHLHRFAGVWFEFELTKRTLIESGGDTFRIFHSLQVCHAGNLTAESLVYVDGTIRTRRTVKAHPASYRLETVERCSRLRFCETVRRKNTVLGGIGIVWTLLSDATGENSVEKRKNRTLLCDVVGLGHMRGI